MAQYRLFNPDWMLAAPISYLCRKIPKIYSLPISSSSSLSHTITALNWNAVRRPISIGPMASSCYWSSCWPPTPSPSFFITHIPFAYPPAFSIVIVYTFIHSSITTLPVLHIYMPIISHPLIIRFSPFSADLTITKLVLLIWLLYRFVESLHTSYFFCFVFLPFLFY